ncbi:hypothetical protein S40293_04993 [Stachybotrys chartarum IBT 40293]|nr:hypothetical protein S40293_04993 [Stachybotrys chartarum IBT 40293]
MHQSTAAASAIHRGKACIPCTRAKRRCDKKLPFCQRCTDKEVLCRYSNARPYARQAGKPIGLARPVSSTAVTDDLDACLALPAFDEIGDAEPSQVHSEWPSINLGFLQEYPTELELSAFDTSSYATTSTVWYASPGSWSIEMCDLGDSRTTIQVSALHGFVEDIRCWLRQWVDQGHCSFIHRELYAETGLPSCLQDAYATLAAYAGKNDKNQELVMQLVGDKAETLLRSQGSRLGRALPGLQTNHELGTVTTADMKHAIAHVQALVVYQFIRLYDGHIRQRATAEKQMSVLTAWRTQLWEQAQSHFSPINTCDMLIDVSESTSFPESSNQWREWILAESVRRTWMVANYLQSVYITLRGDQSECPGSISYTMRQGLWDATSASSWSRLAASHDPLFMRPDPPDQLHGAAAEEEVDDFGRSVVKIVWGTETLDDWATGALKARRWTCFLHAIGFHIPRFDPALSRDNIGQLPSTLHLAKTVL